MVNGGRKLGRARKSPAAGLGALALGTCLLVTLANFPIGLLPRIAAALGVSLAAAGLLIVAYAAAATLTAVPLARRTARLERRGLLVTLFVVLGLANLGGALAPSFAVLLASRVLGGLAHGLFWAIAPPFAGRLVPAGQRGRAVAIVFLGNVVASVAGLPLATLLGQHAGWRAAFFAAAGLCGLTALICVAVLPRLSGAGGRPIRLLALLGGSGLRWIALAAFLTFTAQFAVYSYFAELVEAVLGLGSAAIAPLLLVFGLMGVAGNTLAGRPADGAADRVAGAFCALLAATLAGLALLGSIAPLACLLIAAWGAALAGLSVAIQARVLELVPEHAQDAASALNVVACNAGIGFGTLLGGVLLGAIGMRWLCLCGALIALAALASVRRDSIAAATPERSS